MGRFNRDDSTSKESTEAFNSAAQALRSKVESQVREVVEKAMARALAIEDRALIRANEVEQASQRRADEMVNESREIARQVLSSVMNRVEAMQQGTDALQEEITKAIGLFREEIARLARELEGARESLTVAPAPGAPSEAPQSPESAEPPEAESAPTEREPAEPESAGSAPAESEPGPEPGPAAVSSAPRAREMRPREKIREQLHRLRSEGKLR